MGYNNVVPSFGLDLVAKQKALPGFRECMNRRGYTEIDEGWKFCLDSETYHPFKGTCSPKAIK